MRKPDYARIAELEQQIYGRPVSDWPPRIHERISEATRTLDDDPAESYDEFLREFLGLLVRFIVPGMSLPEEMAGSRMALARRILVWLILGYALLVVCLDLAGVPGW